MGYISKVLLRGLLFLLWVFPKPQRFYRLAGRLSRGPESGSGFYLAQIGTPLPVSNDGFIVSQNPEEMSAGSSLPIVLFQSVDATGDSIRARDFSLEVHAKFEGDRL